MKIAIIGTGQYSCALTYHLQKQKDNEIYLWSENSHLIKQFKAKRKFEFLSKNVKYDSNVYVSEQLEEVLKDASAVFLLVSGKYFKSILDDMKPYYKKNVPIFVGTKGMDLDNLRFYSDYTRKFLKCNSYSFFAGPTFAKDLLLSDPFALTFACSNKIGYKKLERIFPSYVTCEYSFDLYGLEMCSVLKNIYAIGNGILDGLKSSPNVHYTYLSKVIQESLVILKKCNGMQETMFCFGGIGDFLMTTNSQESRNYVLGKMIGSRTKPTEIEAYKKKTTIEGLDSLQNIMNLVNKFKLQDSFLERIYSIVIEKKNPKTLYPKYQENSENF